MNPEHFRYDIQGLRAVAVIIIVLYHYGVSGFSGGFLGVDIFFVISGYLITRNIARETDNNRFSLAKFYGKRIRRLTPAFTVVGAIVLVASLFFLLPSDQDNTAKTFLSGSLLGSNIFLKLSGFGYFGDKVTLFPLLHYWSLSVEEQFYLLWPLVLLLAYPLFMKRKLLALTGLFLATTGAIWLSEWTINRDRGAAFYYVYPRIFEFLFGITVAFLDKWVELPKRHASALAFLGLGLLIGSTAMIDQSMRFPGMTAVPACLGTAFIILGGQADHWVKSLLSTRFFVFFGAISYSLYLWHWPPVALANYFDQDIDAQFIAIVFPILITLSFLTYKYIEKPARAIPLRAAFIAGLFLLPITIASAFLLYVSQIEGYGDGINRPIFSAYECTGKTTQEMPKKCFIGDKSQDRLTFAVWGDSFADQYRVILDNEGVKKGLKGIPLILQGCPPIPGVIRNEVEEINYPSIELCKNFSRRTLKDLLANEDIQNVIISANFFWYAEGFLDGGMSVVNSAKSDVDVYKGIATVVNQLLDANKKISLVLPQPIIPNARSIIRKSYYSGDAPTTEAREFIALEDRFLKQVSDAGMKDGICFIRLSDYFCEDDKCAMIDDDGHSLYSDSSHFSIYGLNKVTSDKCFRL